MCSQLSFARGLMWAAVLMFIGLASERAGAQEPMVESTGWDAVELLGRSVAAGEKRRLFLRASESFAGTSVEIPVLVIRGLTPGPTVCFTAGVHGDELNGIEIVRKVFESVAPPDLSGMLIGVPVANLHGFRRSSRYLPDRRDLNRFFPGHPGGSSASRIAGALFQNVVLHCNRLIDFHTGSFHRTNIPQLRADLRKPAILEMARSFGTPLILHSEGAPGTLRRAAVDANITAITYEAGEPMRFQADEIARGYEGTRLLLAKLGMVGRSSRGDDPEVFYRSRWVRVNDGGIFLTSRELGESVEAGAVLGTVTDPVSNERSQVIAPIPGRIIGMALSQVVIPGFAAFHIGLPGDVLAQPPDAPSLPTLHPDQLDALEHPE
ncbi:MAG: succinylglutamate desuccinylase/aspartoacylase family protein [bacterium]|nr:succinylglutamate desuccinylase/aspartoacylase family protein [bacterium]MCP5069002.1 succinylglutamate desuccinylase/aspartoacylase family protein [bacterium]